jgi:hypothetical protein
MGNRPIFGLLGAAWVGIALAAAGCGECCRNTRPRDKFGSGPAFGKGTLPNTPPMIGDAKKDQPKAQDFPGGKGADVTPASAKGPGGSGVVTADHKLAPPSTVESNKAPAAPPTMPTPPQSGFDSLPPGGSSPGASSSLPALPPPPANPPRSVPMTYSGGPARAPGTPGLPPAPEASIATGSPVPPPPTPPAPADLGTPSPLPSSTGLPPMPAGAPAVRETVPPLDGQPPLSPPPGLPGTGGGSDLPPPLPN